MELDVSTAYEDDDILGLVVERLIARYVKFDLEYDSNKFHIEVVANVPCAPPKIPKKDEMACQTLKEVMYFTSLCYGKD